MNETIKQSVKIKDPARIIERKGNWLKGGISAGGNTLIYKRLKSTENAFRILLIGGVHGNETEGVQFMHDFCREFVDENEKSPFEQDILAIPVMNPDGLLGYQRRNDHEVDLNRNMPTRDWSKEYTEEKYFPGEAPASEPETKCLLDIMDWYKPEYIISFHSWKPLINYNGPAIRYAQKIAEKFDMEITGDIGYPTPGSLGTYSGHERDIPTITLEFDRGIPLEDVYPLARDAVINSFVR